MSLHGTEHHGAQCTMQSRPAGRHEEHCAENCYSHLIGERLIIGSVLLETDVQRRVVTAQMTAGKVEGEF